MQVVVLAGGLATRMLPETQQVPKSLLMVGERPFVDWQLARFKASGARSVVMCVGHLGEEIETHVKRALDRGLMVAYSYDGQQLIGTGGALRRAFARLEDEFVVTYGDSYLPFDYSAPLRDLREHPEALATMCVYRNDGALGASNVALDGDLVARYDKSRPDAELNCIDYGAIALRRSVLQDVADGAVWDLGALWSKLARKRQLRALVIPERFYEIGSPEGRADFEDYLRSEVVP